MRHQFHRVWAVAAIASISLTGSVSTQGRAQPNDASVAATIEAIRTAAERVRAENSKKLLTIIADLRPTSERCHVVFRESDGTYVRLWGRGTRDQNFSGPDPLLDGLKPREAAVAYLTLRELTGDYSRVLVPVLEDLSKAWGSDFDRSLFHFMMVDKAKYPDGYSHQQKWVLSVATPDSLLQTLRSPVGADRRAAALALRLLRHTAAAPQVASLLRDEEMSVRTAATSTLLALDTPQARTLLLETPSYVVPSLRLLLEDSKGVESPPLDDAVKPPELRVRALAMAAKVGEPAAEMLLAHWPNGRAVRQDVTAAVLSMGEVGFGVMQKAEAGTHEALRLEAAQAIRARASALRAAPAAGAPDEFVTIVSQVLAGRMGSEAQPTLAPAALAHLVRSMRSLDTADAGKVSLALADHGTKAATAVPVVVDVFPLEPRTKIAIDVTARVRAHQQAKRDPKMLTQELQKRYGEGTLSRRVEGVFMNNRVQGPSTYYYEVEVPAAVAALHRISGDMPGVTQAAWRGWLAAQKGRTKSGK